MYSLSITRGICNCHYYLARGILLKVRSKP